MNSSGMPAPTKRRRIVIVSGASLAWNPRVLKEASTLARAGFETTVLGSKRSAAGLDRDKDLARRHGFQFHPVGAYGDGVVDRCRNLGRRLRNALAGKWHRITGIESRYQLGPLVDELLSAAGALHADLYVVHLEQALWAGVRLIESGYRVGIDFEDWYSEDLLPEARRRRPLQLLGELEEQLLTKGDYSSCPSKALSGVLSAKFDCRPPAIVYNAFPWADRAALDGQYKDRRDRRVPSIHWYSQTIGAGRGLEELIAALPRVTHDAEVHLRGKLDSEFNDWLVSHVPEAWRERIHLHELVSSDELLSRIAEHDIGFAGERHVPASRDLTVTNKLLQYLLGGVAVVASNTSGQTEVAHMAPGAVTLYEGGNPEDLARAINTLLGDPAALATSKRAALNSARELFSWEQCERTLLDSVASALR